MLYPVLMNYLNSQKESLVIDDYSNKVEKLNNNNYENLLKNAHSYNQTLNNEVITDAFTKDTEISSDEYNNLLNINRDGVIGYIKIPKIDINIPIYHGTSTKVLEKGIGHFEGSSLPVGGESTHSILSGHRGLPSSRLFSDLNQLEIGDMFYIYVLDQVLAYKVDKISVVEPSDIEHLKIEEGKDFITLVTCTPYAINTHRLLVRGTRLTFNEEELLNINVDRKLSSADIILIFGLIIVSLTIISSIIIVRKINTSSKKEELLNRDNIKISLNELNLDSTKNNN